MNILITGGAGFVGSHLCSLLIEKGNLVWVFDNFSSGKRDFLPIDSNLTIVKGDILDTELLKSTIAINKIDILYHLAAIHFIPLCEQRPEFAIRTNVEGTQSVISAIQGLNRPIRLIFTSTGAIYDPSNVNKLYENSPIKTHDIYGMTKDFAEGLLKHYGSKSEKEVIITRLFNVAGSHETNPHIIPAVLEQLRLNNRTIELGNLYPKRDYIHVKDVAEGLFSLGFMKMKTNIEIVNLGSGIEYSVEELVTICGKVLNGEILIESNPVRRRKADRPSQLASINYINEICGWRPTRNLEMAIFDAWDEIQNNK